MNKLETELTVYQKHILRIICFLSFLLIYIVTTPFKELFLPSPKQLSILSKEFFSVFILCTTFIVVGQLLSNTIFVKIKSIVECTLLYFLFSFILYSIIVIWIICLINLFALITEDSSKYLNATIRLAISLLFAPYIIGALSRVLSYVLEMCNKNSYDIIFTLIDICNLLGSILFYRSLFYFFAFVLLCMNLTSYGTNVCTAFSLYIIADTIISNILDTLMSTFKEYLEQKILHLFYIHFSKYIYDLKYILHQIEFRNLLVLPSSTQVKPTYKIAESIHSNSYKEIILFINLEKFIFGTSIITLEEFTTLQQTLNDYSAQAYPVAEFYHKAYATIISYENLIQHNFRFESK